MLKRMIQAEIKEWIKNGKNALLVEGARQVGKTYLIRATLEEYHPNFIEINLIENEEFKNILSELSNNLSSFTNYISLISNKPLIKGETIIFIDEVQEFKEIVTAIKFLVDKGDYRFILSGSLLGVELVNLKSAPVGYLDTITMYPLSFHEFIDNLDFPESLIAELKTSYTNMTPVNEAIHNELLKAFNNYLIVGGMPSAVASYIENNDFNKIAAIHKNIIELYKKDFTKYEEKNKKLSIMKIYELIPDELSDSNKRFKFSSLTDGGRYDKYENSFNWLIDAGVALPIHNLSEPKLPLRINKSSSLFKFFMSDVGLLTSCYGNSTKLQLLANKPSLNAGAIYENVVAQELIAHGFTPYYFSNHKQGELDFVIEYNGSVLPIEVKSGKDYTRHSALNNCLNNVSYGIKDAVVFSRANVSQADNTKYLPIYMIMFLKEDIKIELPRINFKELLNN